MLRLNARLLIDDVEIVRGKLLGEIPNGGVAQFVLPRAFLNFTKESTLRMMMSLEDGEEREVFSRRLIKIEGGELIS